MKESDKERIKLRANYFNGLAIATFVVGGIAPIASMVYRFSSQSDYAAVLIGTVICFIASVGLHMMAGWTVRGLDDDDT